MIMQPFELGRALLPIRTLAGIEPPENQRRPATLPVPVARILQSFGMNARIGKGHQAFDIFPHRQGGRRAVKAAAHDKRGNTCGPQLPGPGTPLYPDRPEKPAALSAAAKFSGSRRMKP
jgi:hypothetical protein